MYVRIFNNSTVLLQQQQLYQLIQKYCCISAWLTGCQLLFAIYGVVVVSWNLTFRILAAFQVTKTKRTTPHLWWPQQNVQLLAAFSCEYLSNNNNSNNATKIKHKRKMTKRYLDLAAKIGEGDCRIKVTVLRWSCLGFTRRHIGTPARGNSLLLQQY